MGLFNLMLTVTVLHRGKSRRELKWELRCRNWSRNQRRNDAYWLALHESLRRPSCRIQHHLPRGSTIHSGPGPPISIIHWENTLTDFPTGQSSSWMTWACVILTKPSQHTLLCLHYFTRPYWTNKVPSPGVAHCGSCYGFPRHSKLILYPCLHPYTCSRSMK